MTGAVTIFIEKRRSCPANLEDAYASSKFAGQDRRFSMKMVTAPVIDAGCSRQNYYKYCGNF
jgi:hypothetical protein